MNDRPQTRGYRALARVAVFAAILFVATGCPPPAEYGVLLTENVVYGIGNVSSSVSSEDWQEMDLLLDVYEPDGKADALKPALLLVHGGSFVEGSKQADEMVEYARFFARRGYVCFSMDYRLQSDYPPASSFWDFASLTSAVHAAMVDVKAAVRFIRANADFYGVDPDKIALLGESAGAIAGVATAVTPSDDFSSDGDDFPIPAENNPGVSARVQAYVHFWGNPVHVLLEVTPSDPPTMIVHGDDDDEIFTPFAMAEVFHGALELWNIPHEFYEADGFGHGAWDYRLRGKNLKTLTLEFLNEQLLGITKAEEMPEF